VCYRQIGLRRPTVSVSSARRQTQHIRNIVIRSSHRLISPVEANPPRSEPPSADPPGIDVCNLKSKCRYILMSRTYEIWRNKKTESGSKHFTIIWRKRFPYILPRWYHAFVISTINSSRGGPRISRPNHPASSALNTKECRSGQ
jgi:hypothetical protein